MKQKIFLKKTLFLAGMIAVLGFMSSSITQAAANSDMLVIGDSIAVGLSRPLDPGKSSARGSAQASAIAGFDGTGNFSRMVISAGSNAPRSSTLETNLRAIRAKQPNARTVWVLPYHPDAKATVRRVASSYGDLTIDLSNYPATETINNPSATPVHPRDYQRVATDILALFGGGGGAPASPSQPNATSASISESPARVDNSAFGLIPCGRKAGQGAVSEPCTACHAVLAGKNLIDYLTRIMVVVAVAVIVAMGVLYIMSGVNANLKKIAKAGLTAVLMGLIFMLSAWLIVSTILRFMANPSVVQGGGGFIGLQAGQGVFGLQCDTTSQGGRGTLAAGGRVIPDGASQGVVGQGSGACSPITNPGNPCSVENLQRNPCWAALGENVIRQASGICNAESRGIPGIPPASTPRTDHCGSASGPVVSHGLFQINVTAHYEAAGCPRIANPPLQNVRQHSDGWYDASCRVIVSQETLQACINRVIDPAWNINYACQLYKNGGNSWRPWNYSYQNKCNSFR